jgi:DnaK suppressor protein
VTPQELGEFREILDLERRRVESAIASLHENGTGSVEDEGRDPGGVGADTASITFDRELEEGLQDGAVQTLAKIDRALERLADGSYATCERCGKPIGGERLRVRPWATLCIDDQRLADRG